MSSSSIEYVHISITTPYLTLIPLRIFCSGTFSFDIGQSKTRFTLHKKLVSRHSEPLDRLMHGGFKESQLGVGCIEDIEPEAFARFAEYIYSGDYSVASPTTDDAEEGQRSSGSDEESLGEKKHKSTSQRGFRFRRWRLQSPEPRTESIDTVDEQQAVANPSEEVFEAEEAPAQAEGQAPDSPTDSVPPEAPYPPEPEPELPPSLSEIASPRSPVSSDDSLSAPRRSRRSAHPLLAPHVPFQLDASPGPNEKPAMDYSPVFMCHAQVCLFAQEFIIPDLKALAVTKLSDSLNIFHCYSRRAADIARLIKYIYSNTPEDDSTPFSMREVVVHYASKNFKVLVSCNEFRELLAEGGSFVPDLCRKVARRL